MIHRYIIEATDEVKGFEEAIERLDREWGIEELEPCNDAISRQTVLDTMCELCDTRETLNENPWRDNPHIDAITDAINNLPPVTPQTKTGHWIYTLEDWNKWECSNCGYTKRTDVHVSIGYKYCPECGARMIKEVKE